MKSREEFHREDYLPALRKRTERLYVYGAPALLLVVCVALAYLLLVKFA